MQLMKFASLTTSTNNKLNERILTPNSIPVFVLPPKLDAQHRNSVENCSLQNNRKLMKNEYDVFFPFEFQ
jgi:hypothetical protein